MESEETVRVIFWTLVVAWLILWPAIVAHRAAVEFERERWIASRWAEGATVVEVVGRLRVRIVPDEDEDLDECSIVGGPGSLLARVPKVGYENDSVDV